MFWEISKAEKVAIKRAYSIYSSSTDFGLVHQKHHMCAQSAEILLGKCTSKMCQNFRFEQKLICQYLHILHSLLTILSVECVTNLRLVTRFDFCPHMFYFFPKNVSLHWAKYWVKVTPKLDNPWQWRVHIATNDVRYGPVWLAPGSEKWSNIGTDT